MKPKVQTAQPELETGQLIAQSALHNRAFNAVPEPAIWALVINGFGLVGAVRRHRRAATPRGY